MIDKPHMQQVLNPAFEPLPRTCANLRVESAIASLPAGYDRKGHRCGEHVCRLMYVCVNVAS